MTLDTRRGLFLTAWLSLSCAAPPERLPRAESPQARPTPAPPPPAPAVTPVPQPAPEQAPSSVDADSPSYNHEVLALRARAQARILGDSKLIEDEAGRVVESSDIPVDEAGIPAWVNGNTLGQFIPVENESALEHFNDALERLATGRDEDKKLRIAVYGASHTQGDLYTGYLRYYLQSRFGNGGPGFMQMALINPWYRKFDFRVKSTGFRTEYAQKKEPPPHGLFGLFGLSVVGRFPYAYAEVSPANDRDLELAADHYELYYAAEPRGGDLKLSIDSQKPIILTGAADQVEARYETIQLGLGWHEVQVRPRGNGPIRLYGISIERSAPGIVVDTLGINGTRAANMLTWDMPLWVEHLTRRSPDLVVFAYGTNETTDVGEPIEVYETQLGEVLKRLRTALPTTSCVLMGPGDFPREGDDGWKTRSRLLDIIDVQRKLAPRYDCAFWDTFEFMGGEGSMHRWVEAKPALGAPDHIHFTARGYVKLGMAFGDALMRSYDAFHLQPD